MVNNMEEKIKNYMDSLFASAPKTRKAMELKEEMTQNTIEKYHDLLGEGHSEEDAFQNVIHSIGDVTELYGDLEDYNLLTLSKTDRRKKAVLTSISIGLYIFAGVIFIGCCLLEPSARRIGYPFDMSVMGLILAGIICIFPTVMLVYAINMYPNYHKGKESLVDSYKEARYTENRTKAIRRSVSVIIWTVTISAYFLVSFQTYAWHITWVIFLIGACVQAAAELLRNLKEM